MQVSSSGLETEYTLAMLRSCLLANCSTKDKPLHSFLRKLAVEFSVSNPELLTCITSTLSLLSSLVEQSSLCNGGGRVPSLVSLCVCVSWVCGEDTQAQAQERRRTHPLVVLSNRIKEAGAEQADLKLTNTSAKLCEIVTLLEKLPTDSVVPTSMELPPLPLLPEPSTPIMLWSGKAVTVASEDIPEEQLTMGYWLLSISQKYLTTLDLYSVSREVTKERTLATERKKK